jgi:predicted GNAT family N-acyltransferase
MIFREIQYGSAEFREECELRDAMLRIPLGLSLKHDDLAAERDQLHFGLFDTEGRIVGCIVAVPLDGHRARIRQMAVAEPWQRQGHGRRIVQEVERRLAGCGFSRLVLHARRLVSPFYERLGYSAVGESFLEVGIPHIRMEKDVAPP